MIFMQLLFGFIHMYRVCVCSRARVRACVYSCVHACVCVKCVVYGHAYLCSHRLTKTNKLVVYHSGLQLTSFFYVLLFTACLDWCCIYVPSIMLFRFSFLPFSVIICTRCL